MRAIIVTEVIGRKNLHQYGHPMRIAKLDSVKTNKYYASHRFTVMSGDKKREYDTNIFMAIYDVKKYKYMHNLRKDTISTFVMITDDNIEKVYKYVSVSKDFISFAKFDKVFSGIGLTYAQDQTVKEERDAISLMSSIPRFNARDYIFDSDSTVGVQFIENHYDFLLENYIDGNTKTDNNALFAIHVLDGRLFKYIDKHCGRMRIDMIDKVIVILDKSIFDSDIFVLSSFTEDIAKDYLEVIIKFIIKDIIPAIYVLRSCRAYRIIDYFLLCYYLMGKPKLGCFDKLTNKELGLLEELDIEYLSTEVTDKALRSVSYKGYIDDILANLTPKEIAQLLTWDTFEPITDRYKTAVNNRRCLTTEQEISLYKKFMNVPSKRAKDLTKSRYIIPTKYTRLMLSIQDFESSIFFVYMQTNYANFLKDSEVVIHVIMNSFALQKILTGLDCDKFVNNKVKEEFVRILLIQIEVQYDRAVLMDIMRKVNRDGKMCPQLYDMIMQSSCRKVKEVCKVCIKQQ